MSKSQLFYCLVLVPVLALGQTKEEDVLAGPCVVETGSDVAQIQAWHALVNQFTATSEPRTAIALAKQIVRGRCSNEFWRFRLVELLATVGEFEAATAVLDGFYERGSNAVSGRVLKPSQGLRLLLASAEFKRSKVAAKLAADRTAL